MGRRSMVLGLLVVVGCAGQEPESSPLPVPTGPYAVGTRVLDALVDPTRPDDRFARGSRTVNVQVWYPGAA